MSSGLTSSQNSSEFALSATGLSLADLLVPVASVLRDASGLPPGPDVVGRVAVYGQYVRFLHNQLGKAIQDALISAPQESQLEQLAKDLFKVEIGRKDMFEPLLVAGLSNRLHPDWIPLRDELWESVNRELTVIRDTRINLELKRAELINRRQAGTRVRVVLRGGAQIRMYLKRLPQNDSSKG